MNDEKNKIAMLDELQKYKKDPKSFKRFSLSMKELSNWLEEKQK